MHGFKLVTLTFSLWVVGFLPRGRTDPAPPEDFRTRLPRLWKQQAGLMTTGRFSVRVARLRPELSREEFDRLLATLDVADVPGFLDRLYKQFPLAEGVHRLPLSPVEVRAERGRSMEIWHRDPPDERELYSISCNLAGIHVSYHAANRQATVSHARIHVLNISDLRYLPAVQGDGLSKVWQVAARADGRITLRAGDGQTATEMVVDDQSGFVYRYRQRANADGTETRDMRQLAPVTDAKGRIMPTVVVVAQFDGNRVQSLYVYHIAKADLDATFTDADFVVSAPARTNVVDIRGGAAENAKRNVAKEPVPDVLANADAIPDDARSIWPVLKPGTPAPPVEGLKWVTGDGPDLKGKVVLLDFWGIGCGPCVAQLPDVEAAAKKHAKTGLVVVGIHNAGVKAEDVASFARGHKLTFHLAIDRAETNHYGATFRAYGIRGIPNAAVVDRDGRIVYVGKFKEALAKAEAVLAEAKLP